MLLTVAFPSLVRRLSMPLQPSQPIPHRIRTPRSHLVPFLGPPLHARRRGTGMNIVLRLGSRVDGRVGE